MDPRIKSVGDNRESHWRTATNSNSIVIAGLDPAIHAEREARDKIRCVFAPSNSSPQSFTTLISNIQSPPGFKLDCRRPSRTVWLRRHNLRVIGIATRSKGNSKFLLAKTGRRHQPSACRGFDMNASELILATY